jgi:hypothetical protein
MKIILEYEIGKNTEVIELSVSDTFIARAQTMGIDLVSVEYLAKQTIDRFVERIASMANFTGTK